MIVAWGYNYFSIIFREWIEGPIDKASCFVRDCSCGLPEQLGDAATLDAPSEHLVKLRGASGELEHLTSVALASLEHARWLLSTLSGRTHSVYAVL